MSLPFIKELCAFVLCYNTTEAYLPNTHSSYYPVFYKKCKAQKHNALVKLKIIYFSYLSLRLPGQPHKINSLVFIRALVQQELYSF